MNMFTVKITAEEKEKLVNLFSSILKRSAMNSHDCSPEQVADCLRALQLLDLAQPEG